MVTRNRVHLTINQVPGAYARCTREKHWSELSLSKPPPAPLRVWDSPNQVLTHAARAARAKGPGQGKVWGARYSTRRTKRCGAAASLHASLTYLADVASLPRIDVIGMVNHIVALAGLRGSSLRFPLLYVSLPRLCFNNKAWGPQAMLYLSRCLSFSGSSRV